MKKNKKVFIVFLFFLYPVIFHTAAQTISYGSAHEKALLGDYDSVLIICDSLLVISPGYLDAIVLKARVKGWQNEFSQARNLLNNALGQNPVYYDALDAFSDVEYWDHQFEDALVHVNNALVAYPNDTLFIKKKNLLESLINEAIEINGECGEYILFQYYFDFFNEYYKRRWNVFSIGKPVNFDDKYLLLPKINLGSLSPVNGITTYNALQLETDFFYVPDSSYYIYVNSALANFRLFPRYKAAFEYFMTYLFNTEISVGFRYMLWEDHNFYSTLSLSKYWGNYWVMFRPYFPFRDFGEANAYLLTVRRYLTPKEYLGLSYVFGAAPDQSFDQFLEHGAFKSQKFVFYGDKNITNRYKLTFSISFSNEEYRLNQFQNRFDLLLGVTWCY